MTDQPPAPKMAREELAPVPAQHEAFGDSDRRMTRTYLRVVAIELIVLAALWLFQVHFSY